MTIPDDYGPLRQIYDICEHIFEEKAYGATTIDKAIFSKIVKAKESGMVNEAAADQILGALERFKGRQLEDLTESDKTEIKTIFERVVGVDSAYGSQEAPSRKELLVQAGFNPEDDIRQLQQEQQKFQKQIESVLRRGSIVGVDGQSTGIKQEGSAYILFLKPFPQFFDIQKEDLYATETALAEAEITEALEAPLAFLMDHWKNKRGHYITTHFSQKSPIVVREQKDAEDLLASAQEFINQISSKELSAEMKDKLFRGLLLFTTQHIGNGLIAPQLLLQLDLTRKYGEDESGQLQYETYIDSVTCNFQSVVSWGKQKKDQFKVSIKAQLLTERKPKPEGMLMPDQKQERSAARKALGLEPALKGDIECSFICSITSKDDLKITDMDSKYRITVGD